MAGKLSRRDFLKLAGASALGAGVAPIRRAAAATERSIAYGRCLMIYLTVYSRPSVYGRQLAYHPFDAIIPLYEAVAGEDESAHNPNWYRTHGGYVHASNVQPVRWRFNLPRRNLAPGGQLVELTVPYTTARVHPDLSAAERYRLYHGTTYWAAETVSDPAGLIWYALWDDRINETFFALAHTLRIVRARDLLPLAPEATDKWVQVDVTAQRLTAFEGDTPVIETLISSGRNYSGDEGLGDFRTPLGTYYIYRKRSERHMAAGDAAAPDFYDLPGVSWVAYFSGGMAFHGTFWHNDYGTPWSHGCVNMRPEDALWLYRWTAPHASADEQLVEETGTRVEVV